MVIQRASPATLVKEVLYIGSAVPLETSEGLEAIQQPLRSRYPVDNDDNIQGILSTITVLPAGIQLRYKNDPSHVVLFPFSALNMCAAVRCVRTTNAASNEMTARFVSLSSQEAAGDSADRPSIFTAITRRTKGRQVLECHGFVTTCAEDALELVQWVSGADQRAKQSSGIGAVGGGGGGGGGGGVGGNFVSRGNSFNHSATYEATNRGDMSFRTDSSALSPSEFPIQLVPGEPVVQNAPSDFYKEPPKTGYFYSTKHAQAKKYSLQKFSGGGGGGGGSAGGGGFIGVNDSGAHLPPSPVGVMSSGGSVIMSPGPHVHSPSHEHFERRSGYAASAYSVPAYSGPVPRPPMMVPVRDMRPPPHLMMRPVMIPPPPGYAHAHAHAHARSRFFSPPPPMLRARPVPVLVPPPPGVFYDRHTRRGGSRGSSGSSSRSSSPSPHSTLPNGKGHHHRHSKNKKSSDSQGKQPQHHDNSSDISSRPRTPPTDYDGPKGPRVSRRDEFYARHSYNTKERNGHGSPPMGNGHAKGMRPPPHGYYMIPPQYGYYAGPPPAGFARPRSVPPYGFRGSMDRKEKKSKKSKKDRKKKKKQKSKRGYRGGDEHDESTDSVGYTSELSPTDKNQPRDFRRTENQFQHERAFSKSLAEETRKSHYDDSPFNAYHLNRTGENENDFPIF